MTDTFRKIRDLLDARERRNAVILFVMMLFMGLFEVVGVVSIMPFVAVLAKPDVVHTNNYLSTMYQFLGFSSTNNCVRCLGGLRWGLVVGSRACRARTQWAAVR